MEFNSVAFSFQKASKHGWSRNVKFEGVESLECPSESKLGRFMAIGVPTEQMDKSWKRFLFISRGDLAHIAIPTNDVFLALQEILPR